MGGGMSKFGVTYGSKAYKLLKATSQNRDRDRDRGGHFANFGAGHSALTASTDFFNEHSNSLTWSHGEINGEEYDALKWYTGMGYLSINKNMYTVPYNDMPASMQQTVDNMEKGLNKFVLTKGIQVTRQCDFKVFGAKSGEKMTMQQIRDYINKNGINGVLQTDGFLSAGANNHGAAIEGSGLVIHYKVPPSIGAGAYVNPISAHSGANENEFLFNNKALFKYDTNSMYVDGSGKNHINAMWKGRKRKQSFVK